MEPRETVSASKKLGEKDAAELVSQSSSVVIAKGKTVTLFSGMLPPKFDADGVALAGYKVNEIDGNKKSLIAHMLGATGNLRAPTITAGGCLLVGFNEAVYTAVLL
ncbi:MAG: hypothetical protein ACYTHJ_09825 [Planctomycetota bacterium]|jgi:hypothetical protein